MKRIKILGIITIIFCIISILKMPISNAATTDLKVNLTKLTYTENGTEKELVKYTQDDFEKFLSAYKAGSLPDVYITEFLFDGVSMVKSYDLDDFVESGNDVKVKTLSLTVININKTGNIEFTGELTGGMIAVDTNGRTGEINIILNNVKLDTDSKKAPAIYVYNKDITYTDCKVTIKTVSGSKNYIEGGKLKKVSLVGSDELSSYTSKYSGDIQTTYSTYTNYYGVYTSSQLNNILFAKVQADSEDLRDGDPYYFYKAAAAISSDIDLYFEGTGYLEVTSKNNEGIETKGNLTFSGGTGDYVINAKDDCLNTTTTSSSNSSARNELTIDVGTLYAIVDAGEDADEGDAIDSNGTLTINGGTIVAIAHPGQDAGLDSQKGTYINGGTVIATGDMYDEISNQSKQNFMVLRFSGSQIADTLITLLDENDDVVMAYKTDRSYTTLVYSSSNLKDGIYYLYKDGTIEGTENNGYYTKVTSYTKGTQLGYSSTGAMGGAPGGMPGNMNDGNMPQGEPPTDMPEPPEGFEQNSKMNKPNSMKSQTDMGNNTTASNKEFKISGISNQFSGVSNYSETSNNSETKTNSSVTESKDNNANNNTVLIIIIVSLTAVIVILIVLMIAITKKNKKEN